MTDDPTPDDAAEEAVSRLLAGARHTTPLPTDVAARLDEVLADLRRTRPAAGPVRSTVVVPIASRRRRRLTTGLVAAAAVVAVGVALPHVTGGLDGSSDTASDTAAGGSSDTGDQLSREGSAESQTVPEDPAGDPGAGAGEMAPLPSVSPDRFRRDALRARPQAVASYTAAAPACGVLPAGDVVPVRYQDQDGYLVFGAPASSRQRVELYLCPDGELVRRAVIPAP